MSLTYQIPGYNNFDDNNNRRFLPFQTDKQMLTTDQKQAIRAVPITAYLASKGILPVLQSGGEYCYFSPLRKEKTPSFFVNISANVYHDFAEPGTGTDNIKLVMLMENCDFLAAITKLRNVDPDLQIELMEGLPASPQYQSFVKRITPLKHPALINYITKQRGIPLAVAKREVSEIHYSTSRGDFFSLGFKNISGGWELRNPSFKGCIGHKDISVCGDPNAAVAIIFEGFMDYLSYLKLTGRHYQDVPTHVCFYILNSLSLLNKLPDLRRFDIVQCFLDNDQKGKAAALALAEKYDNTYNASHNLFPNYKDFNEFLTTCYDKTATH